MTGHALYVGTLRHLRLAPRRHCLRHRVVLPLVDIDEAEGDGSRALGRRRPGIVRLVRTDFLPHHRGTTLREAVEACAAEAGAPLAPGPIRLLANLRCFGHCFNPAAFFYCYAADEEQLQAIVVEVTNTPWGERHVYVMHAGAPGSALSGRLDKVLHVSPFMAMGQVYRWRATTPSERLHVGLTSREGGRAIFHAALDMQRHTLGRTGLTGATLRRPVPSASTLALIYAHAGVLRAKGIRMVGHP